MTQTTLEYETRSFWALIIELRAAIDRAERETVMAEMACLHMHAKHASVRQAIDRVLDRDMAERAFARGAALINPMPFDNCNEPDAKMTNGQGSQSIGC